MLNLFRRKPTASEAARQLGAMARRDYRERVRARAREMRAEMGLPPVPEFEPR